ncbi:hypothetical protein D1872_348050 [compost metagenome]
MAWSTSKYLAALERAHSRETGTADLFPPVSTSTSIIIESLASPQTPTVSMISRRVQGLASDRR